MLPLYTLWASVWISSLRLAVVQILLTCIPSQIVGDIVTHKYLIVSTFIFEDGSLRSIWSMVLLFPFPCYLHHIAFGKLISHTPFPCPTSKLIYILLKVHCVLCILNVSITNTVISKESYFTINVCRFTMISHAMNGETPGTWKC